MVSSLSIFPSISLVVNHQVKLPNGNLSHVTNIGTVHISDSLTLHNALCVLSFSFNLISTSRLAKDSFCCLTFFTNYCVIQDLHTWRMIGMGEQQAGLYYLLQNFQNEAKIVSSSIPSTSKVVSVISPFFDLWHYRLGHLSPSRLLLLNKSVLDIKVSNTTPCIVYPFTNIIDFLFP